MLRYILLFGFILTLFNVNAQFDAKAYDKLIKSGKKSLKKEYFSLAIDDFETALAMVEEPEAYQSEAYYSLADAQMKSELYDAAYGNFETSLRLGEGLLDDDFIEETKSLMNTCLELSGDTENAEEDEEDEDLDDLEDDDLLADDDEDFTDDDDDLENDLDENDLDEDIENDTDLDDNDSNLEDTEEEFSDETSTPSPSIENNASILIDQVAPEFVSSININTSHEALQSIADNESEGLIFKVQIGAFSNRVATNAGYFSNIYDPIATRQLPNNIFIYTIGSYSTLAAANAKRQSLSTYYPDAFIVAIYEDERANIKKVIELLAQ